MPKILNKIGKCNNCILQYKTSQNKYKGTFAKSVDTLVHKVSRKISSIMLGHPTKCAVVDNEISDKSAAILCIKLANNYTKPKHSLSCTYAEIKQMAYINIYIHYLKRGHLYNIFKVTIYIISSI